MVKETDRIEPPATHLGEVIRVDENHARIWTSEILPPDICAANASAKSGLVYAALSDSVDADFVWAAGRAVRFSVHINNAFH